MADESGGMAFLGFVLGGAIVVLAIVVSVIYGSEGTGPKTVNLEEPATTGQGSR